MNPLAEKYNNWSPYTYTYNNPILYIDIDGCEGYPRPKDLTKSEKKFIVRNRKEAMKISQNARLATNMTIKTFGYNGENDHSDAFRHAYWQALNTQSIGSELTLEYADAHEDWEGNDPVVKKMDDMNNRMGIYAGKKLSDASPEELAKYILQMLIDGNLFVIDPNTGEIIRSENPNETNESSQSQEETNENTEQTNEQEREDNQQ